MEEKTAAATANQSSLILRNTLLAGELNKVKAENASLRSKLNEYRKKELKVSECHKSTQTSTEDLKDLYLSPESKAVPRSSIKSKSSNKNSSVMTPPASPRSQLSRYSYSHFRVVSPPPVQRKPHRNKFIRLTNNSNENSNNNIDEITICSETYLTLSPYTEQEEEQEELVEDFDLNEIEAMSRKLSMSPISTPPTSSTTTTAITSSRPTIQVISTQPTTPIPLPPPPTTTTTTTTTHQRSRRETKIPTSYKEPPLNTKIREGHKFFKFTKRN